MDPSRRGLIAGLGAVALTAGCTRYTLPEPGRLEGGGPRPAAGVRLRTFADDGSRRDGLLYPYEVHVELWLLRDEADELVHRGRHPGWERSDLVPGEYELVVVEVSEPGRVRAPAGRKAKRFRVLEGELAEVQLTVESFPWEAVLAVTIVVVVVAVVVAVALNANPSGAAGGGGGGSPPPIGVGAAPLMGGRAMTRGAGGAWVVEPVARELYMPVDVYVNVVLWADDDLYDYPPPAERWGGLDVASVRPVGRHGGVDVRFTRPVRPEDLGPDTLSIHGANGRVAVGVSVRDDGLTARVRPLRPLAPGRWVVRVLGRAIYDERGSSMGYDLQRGFEVS